MKCTKCGNDSLRKDGDWLICLQCGNTMFDTSIHLNGQSESPTKLVEQIDSNLSSPPTKHTKSKEKAKKESLKFKKVKQDSSANSTFSLKDGEENTKEDVATDTSLQNDFVNKKSKLSKVKEKSNKAKKDDKEQAEPNKVKDTLDFFLPIVIAVVIAIILKTLVFANAIVPTGSMINTIQEKDRIIASRLSYKFDDPKRYDIIIFSYPDDETQPFVKRIIGLPGETVTIKSGIVFVTNSSGKTEQLRDDFVTNCVPNGDFGPYKVPENSYFVMGDNRNDSLDSRYWNNKFVKKDKIIGKVMFRYYPNVSKIK